MWLNVILSYIVFIVVCNALNKDVAKNGPLISLTSHTHERT